jgi:hypothetical protein
MQSVEALRLGYIAMALGSSACVEQPLLTATGGNAAAAAGSSGATGGTGANTGGSPAAGSGGGLVTPGGAAGASGVGGTAALPSDWFDPAWAKRRKVTVSDPQLTEALQEFQVPVRLSAQSFDYASAQPKGEDLRFVTPDGVVLKHEVETWDPVGGSLIWLLLPTLGAAPVQVWLYSGNALSPAPAEPDRRAVWPTPYSAVWHMAGDVADSASSAYAAENVGGTFTDGKLGQGLNLTRSAKQYVVVSPGVPIPIISGAVGSTFSAWVNPGSIDGSPGDGTDEQDNGSVLFTVGGHSTDNHNSYTGYNVSYEGRMITHVDPADQGSYRRVRSEPGVIHTNEWAWVTYVVDLAAGEVRFYKNGATAGAVTEGAFNATSYDPEASLQVVIGTEEDLTKHFWDGALDELRIEKGMRSATWIAAQYRAMTMPDYVNVTAE